MMGVERIVLRAELVHETRRIVAHTTELSARTVFVRTDESLAIGSMVLVRLSFPRLFPTVEIEAEVLALEADAGHGYFAGLRLGFVQGGVQQALLAELLDSQDAPPGNGDTYRILVVEDSAVIRDCLQLNADRFAARRSLHVQIDSIDSAEQALEMFERNRYELALVDLYLPGTMTGADLVRALRRRERPDLPVIGFSIGGPAAREAFLSAGADLFLDKPVVVKDVFTTLERLMRMRGKPDETNPVDG
jgi:CheY-like chemotaxis protein